MAEAVVGYLLEKSGVWERVTQKLGLKKDEVQLAFQEVFEAALEEVDARHPNNALTRATSVRFWKHESVVPLLARYFDRENRPTPHQFAQAWNRLYPASTAQLLPFFETFDTAFRAAFRDPKWNKGLGPFIDSQDTARAADAAERAATGVDGLHRKFDQQKATQRPSVGGDSISGNVSGSEAVAMGRGARAEVHKHYYPADAPPTVDPDEALALLETMPTGEVSEHATLPGGSRMTLRANSDFVGREDDLVALAKVLKGGSTAAIGQVAAAAGLGGIGKTQLAAEFAHRYERFFAGGVYWLSFPEVANVPAEIAACGLEMTERPTSYPDMPLDQQVAWVERAWRSPLPRLLIFDNCEEAELLEERRPKTGGCRVLLTTRRTVWSASRGVQLHKLETLAR